MADRMGGRLSASAPRVTRRSSALRRAKPSTPFHRFAICHHRGRSSTPSCALVDEVLSVVVSAALDELNLIAAAGLAPLYG
ncbi:hypothetical protein [Nonomuraea roseoviolacea]|uniref:hypothetical protein n=1 Tax=Nonomuraea roseoviolacea TaxID=103837 RepID=UPI0031D8E7B0